MNKFENGELGIICLDNFKTGRSKWITELSDSGKIELKDFNIITDDIGDIEGIDNMDFIFHMASIASPTFYRMYPIETLDANVSGLRQILDYYRDKNVRRIVFFSSSEIYGDPDAAHIPTNEEYRGYVDCKGPRACYDEAKRFGETLCYLYSEKYRVPITIIRPFNNYGPGMRLNDARVPADFARAVLEGKNIEILSDGSPTRTFCYISDAITGYIKGAAYKEELLNTFNIGIDSPEISIKQLAEIYRCAGKEIFGYSGDVVFSISEDADYLNNNPDRRCPDISKARKLLDYNPKVYVEEGVKRFLEYISESRREELIW